MSRRPFKGIASLLLVLVLLSPAAASAQPGPKPVPKAVVPDPLVRMNESNRCVDVKSLAQRRADPQPRVRVVVDQYLASGRQDFGAGRARPFLTGMVGLTRYAADGDNEVRSVVSAGGAHLALQRHLGVRLESRVFTTIVDADTHGGVCGGRGCVVGPHVNVAWQIEFIAGLIAMF